MANWMHHYPSGFRSLPWLGLQVGPSVPQAWADFRFPQRRQSVNVPTHDSTIPPEQRHNGRDESTGGRGRRRPSVPDHSSPARPPVLPRAPAHRTMQPPRPILRRPTIPHEPPTPQAAPNRPNPGVHINNGWCQGNCPPHCPPAPIVFQCAAPPPITSFITAQITPGAIFGQFPAVQTWVTPPGNVVWYPHPQPHPQMTPTAFWSLNPLVGTVVPQVPMTVLQVTGGHPLPGTAPNWAPCAWPNVAAVAGVPIILAPWLAPNPSDPHTPHVVWDIAHSPATARQITARHLITDMWDAFDDPATRPETTHIVIVCNLGQEIHNLWGAIDVEKTTKITVWDVMDAVHKFFQTPLTQHEVDYISRQYPDNYDNLVASYDERCRTSQSLLEWERQQGIRRVDVLGDRRIWWGTWITYNLDNTWQLNLGFVDVRRES